eukprot:9848523-Prorocentrum_lima.AAC.1
MTSSLVGSEMCIRDSVGGLPNHSEAWQSPCHGPLVLLSAPLCRHPHCDEGRVPRQLRLALPVLGLLEA